MVSRRASESQSKQRTPQKSRGKPSGAASTSDKVGSPSPTPRKRLLASDFASKNLSVRKRRKSKKAENEGEDVDKLLYDLRGLADGGEDAPKELRDAFARAKAAYEHDKSGSSSDDEESGASSRPKKAAASRKKETPSKAQRKKDDNSKQVPDGVRTPVKQLKGKMGESSKLKSTSKKERIPASKKKKSAFISKTASAHKADIEALKKEDPDFHKFLEETDPTLLDFGLDSDVDSDRADEDEMEIEREEVAGDDNENSSNGESSEDNDSNQDAAKDEERAEKIESRRKSLSEPASGKKKQERRRSARNSVLVNGNSQRDNVDSANKMDPQGKSDSEEMNGVADAEQSIESEEEGAESEDIGNDADEEDDDDDDDDEAMAEAEAAAEAGLDVMIPDDSPADDAPKDKAINKGNDSVEQPKRLIAVDSSYLSNIREQLKSNRSSLKAAKELMRIFRAGKEVISSSASKEKKRGREKKLTKINQEDRIEQKDQQSIEEDQFADDGSFTSGKVKFASAKVYQQAMNLAITGVQDALDRMLGKPTSKKGAEGYADVKWDPSTSKRWVNLQPLFRPYVYHMVSFCEIATDPKTLRFLLKRMEKFVPYTKPSKGLLKKLLRIAVQLWSSDGQYVSEATRLRAYLLLSKLAHGPGNAETVLRSCCSSYSSKIAGVCNPKTLPRIRFATSCLVELFGIDMGASYTTAFSNLRELAVGLRAVLVSKSEKEEVERIHNWSYVNQLRLWSRILGRYGGEDELQPLIYPYVQITLGVMRVHATPKTFPLRLHLTSYLSDLVAQTGTFIPLAPELLSLLRCGELRKKPVHGNSKPLEWRALLRVSDEAIKTKPFLTGIINGVVLQLAKFFSTISKHVSFPEISFVAETALRKFSKECGVKEWNTKIMSLVRKLHETSMAITSARSKADFSPQGAVSDRGMLATVPGIDKDMKMPIQRLFAIENERVSKEEKMRDEKSNDMDRPEGDDKEDSDAEESEDSSEAPPTEAKKGNVRAMRKKGAVQVLIGDDVEEEDELRELRIDSDDSDE